MGAGVQTTAIAEMVVEGELDAPDVAIFADTGNEPKAVYEHLEYIARRLSSVGVPLVTVTKGSRIQDDALGASHGRFASVPLFVEGDGRAARLRRQCTKEYKIVPVAQEMRRRMAELGLATENSRGQIRVNGGVRAELWLGISLDEAVRRMKTPRNLWQTYRYPLVEMRMTRAGCLAWLGERGLPTPPRSACLMCPYHGDTYWRALRAEGGGEWEWVQWFDGEVRNALARVDSPVYLHRRLLPIADALEAADAEMARDPQLTLWDLEDGCDEGFCGV
jgi:hypothetical protein